MRECKSDEIYKHNPFKSDRARISISWEEILILFNSLKYSLMELGANYFAWKMVKKMNCKILKLRVKRLFVLMHISHAQNYKRVIFIRLQDIKCLGCFVKWHELCIFAIGISISSQERWILKACVCFVWCRCFWQNINRFFSFYPLCERMGGKKKYSVNEAFRASYESR